jgi:hypothetical protein
MSSQSRHGASPVGELGLALSPYIRTAMRAKRSLASDREKKRLQIGLQYCTCIDATNVALYKCSAASRPCGRE